VGSGHPLLGAAAQAAIERGLSAPRPPLGQPGIHQPGRPRLAPLRHPARRAVLGVAKLSPAADAREQFTAELAGLRLLSRVAPVPVPVASGLAETPTGALLLYEALPERPPEARVPRDWRPIGQVLAAVHQTRHERFGLDGPRGFFGPLPQDNRPVTANQWADFYRERRLDPMLRVAVNSGYLPPALAAAVRSYR
jgi:fructosamine-3-kinase